MDEMTLTLNNPLTEGDWELIEDADFDKTNSIEFHTKHGKTVKFVKCTDERTGDTISRRQAIDIERRATVDTNPYHFKAHQKFMEFMDNPEISSYGRWQWSNGFNTALTAISIDLKKLPSAQPEPIRINLNETIKVKLTDWGKEIYYHQYDRINQIAGREICKPSFPKEDENGYTEFQLWCFMELYGEHIGMTLPNVIEPLEIVYER